PHIRGKENADELLQTFVGRLSDWMNIHPQDVVRLWTEALREQWGNSWQVRWHVAASLDQFNAWFTPDIRGLLELLLSGHQNAEREFLGKPISLFVAATNTGDDLLWSWITYDCEDPSRIGLNSRTDLHCHPHELCSPTFLRDRLSSSEALLNAAVMSILKWSEQSGQYYRGTREFFDGLLHHTSWEREYSDTVHHVDGIDLLFLALEEAVASHVKNNSSWWQQHKGA